jgi:hypothetical protein
MKKSELKNILKPIVGECIKESLMEDGLISSIIAEVARAMASPPPQQSARESVDPDAERMKRNAFDQKKTHRLQEHRSKLMAVIDSEAYNGVNLFEGTMPSAEASTPTEQSSPLSDQAPSDPGVDISNLFGSVAQHWGAHMNGLSEKERK